MHIHEVQSRLLFATELAETPLVVAACEAVPTVFVTEDEPTKGHHTAWFAGTIVLRDYSWNRFVGDLWLLHELHHVALARRNGTNPSVPWTQWMARMISDEFEASFLTEVLVYLREPWLRERTFAHEIWADRILQDPTLKSRFLPGSVEHYARALRYQVIAGGEPMDFPSRQIRAYHDTNNEWVVFWQERVGGRGPHAERPAWRVVEEFLSSGRIHDIEAVRDFLASVSDTNNVPFPEQAYEFDKVYRRNNRLFGNHLFSA